VTPSRAAGNPAGRDGIQGGGEAGAAQGEVTSSERAADLAAVRRCLAGERAAFGELVARWQDRIFAAVYRMTGDAEDARDVAQETFLRAWSGLRTFEGGSAFGTWLYSIALNQVRSEMRRRAALKRGTPASLDAPRGEDGEGLDPPSPTRSAEDAAAAREHVALLQEAVASLDDDSREVIVLREFQDLSYEEIAEAVGVPVGTVRSRLFRAREELRRRLDGKVL
jgi:RNA polymerase sigma-70 factor, ECF subfamily